MKCPLGNRQMSKMYRIERATEYTDPHLSPLQIGPAYAHTVSGLHTQVFHLTVESHTHHLVEQLVDHSSVPEVDHVRNP